MASFLFKTRGNATPSGKPRVYFTCHPDDFSLHFERIAADILASQDCAIYYTENMREEMGERELSTDLGQMNLFVIPVTRRLLVEPSRAMDVDLAFAKAAGIPILPFMMETGIDADYAAPDRFGELQYLCPNSTDDTEIRYEDKLKKYLESVLISDEMAKRVRAAFDAYIFLSYRKKDRFYANQLMRAIHAQPEYRDVAIWYDEFLTPGESFQKNIERALQSSALFALLVTPSLLEEPGGKPNFVMGEEYPAARRAGMEILPAEMVKTDRQQLMEKYASIPDCVDPADEQGFRARLLDALVRIAKRENDHDSLHNFLIGLAYLEGIDVEVDRARGLALIESAADAGLCEAMEWLYDTYSDGVGVLPDYRRAIPWGERLVAAYERDRGADDPDTLTALGNLCVCYNSAGEYQRAKEGGTRVYEARCRLLGEEHPDTLTALGNLAVTYSHLGDYERSRELKARVYEVRCRVLGEDDPDTLLALSNLAVSHSKLGDHAAACECEERVIAARQRLLGEEHPATLASMNNLFVAYSEMGENERAVELGERTYEARCRVLGQEHPLTLKTLGSLAVIYGDLGEHEREAELEERLYRLRCRVLGETHPDTILSLVNLAATYDDLGEGERAIEHAERAAELYRQTLGEMHPTTLVAMNNLAIICGDHGDRARQRELEEIVLERRLATLGEEHPDTISTMDLLGLTCYRLGDLEEARALRARACLLYCKVLGEEHPDTLIAVSGLALIYSRLEDYELARECNEHVYDVRRRVLGDTHRSTLLSLANLAYSCGMLEEHVEAVVFYERLNAAYRTLGMEGTREAAMALHNTAWSYAKLGEIARAVALYERAYEIKCLHFGEDADTTQLTKRLLEEQRGKL